MDQNELLNFVRNYFEEMRIHTRLIDAPYKWDDAFDLNLRRTLLKDCSNVISTFSGRRRISMKNTWSIS